MYRAILLCLSCCALTACSESEVAAPATTGGTDTQPSETSLMPGTGYTVYTGASIWDGTGSPVQIGRNLLVRDGRIAEISAIVPVGANVIDLQGMWIVPGFINAHGHVSGRWADESIVDEGARVRGDLALYARYGITSVLSLGGAGPGAFASRNDQQDAMLAYARVQLAGAVVAQSTSAAALETARANVQAGADWMKLRVDDNLGSGEKMPWNAIHDAINVAREAEIPVATHIFYLEDAERLLEIGVDLIAHSVRDQEVTEAFTQALLDTGACYVPTLTREVSTFIYESRPAFFDDPFFLEAAKQTEIERVSDPEFMARVAASPSAAAYKQALEQAKENLGAVAASGAPIAFGTDSGPAGRFPGYFEHLEFELMAESGMTPEQILLSATSVAAKCVQQDDVGTLEAGKWADFVVLAANPLDDIRATRSIEQVVIAGNKVNRD